MKKLLSLFGLLALVTTFAAGCVDEEPNYNNGGEQTDQPIGYLTLDNFDLNIVEDTDQNSDRNTSSTRAASNPSFVTGSEAASTDDYHVEILPVDGGTAAFAGSFSELKTRISNEQAVNGKGMAIPVGTYTVKAWSNTRTDRLPDLLQSTPSYAGSTPADKPLSIVKGEKAAPVTVTCTLANIKVTVEIEESLRKNQAGESILDIEEAWVNLGETKFTYKHSTDGWDSFGVSAGEDGGMEFDGPTKPVYFRAVNDENVLQFHFMATPTDGNTVTLNKNIPNVKAGHWRRIKIVGKHDTQGNLTFDIEVSTLVQDETIQAGDDPANAQTSTWAEDTMVDPDDAAGAPVVEWQGGDVNADIAVGASNPTANNLTIRTANKIASIALAVTTTNSEFASDAEAMTVADLCTVESSRTLDRYGIPYGSALVGKEELAFSLNSIMDEIRGYNGRYVFTLDMTDQKGFTTTQALTFVVGDAPAAVPPTIVWVGYDIDQVQTATQDMTIKIDITAVEHFEKIIVNIISERLTPEELAGVGLPATFDLCNVQSFTQPDGEVVPAEDLSNTLVGLLGLTAINDDLKALSSTSFDVSTFVGMLGGVAAGTLCTFELTVEGSNGESLTKSIKLDIPEDFGK